MDNILEIEEFELYNELGNLGNQQVIQFSKFMRENKDIREVNETPSTINQNDPSTMKKKNNSAQSEELSRIQKHILQGKANALKDQGSVINDTSYDRIINSMVGDLNIV